MLRINNPFYRSADELVADEMNSRVISAMTVNASAIGKIAGLAEIKAFLLPADKVNFTPAVFRAICVLNGWGIAEE